MTGTAPLAPELTVVVPCFNERPNVAPMVAKLGAALAGVAWEVVFVDDNSPDGTWIEAKRLALTDGRVRCIRRVGRRGLASAVVEGMLSSVATHVAVLDGDLQHDETILPRMLQLLRDGQADVVIGSRHVGAGAVGEGLSVSRAQLSDLGARLAQALLPQRVADPMSGFFMMPRALIEELAPGLSAQGFKILLDILLTSQRVLRVTEVPYTFRPRVAGESKLTMATLVEYLGLLADKAFGAVLPRRFLAFALVGLAGLVVHMVLYLLLRRVGGAGFESAQIVATVASMAFNFFVNNEITYRDQRLRGPRLLRGLALFFLVCGLGAAANVGIASLLHRDGLLRAGLAGAAGALITLVWNYVMSSTLVWRTR